MSVCLESTRETELLRPLSGRSCFAVPSIRLIANDLRNGSRQPNREDGVGARWLVSVQNTACWASPVLKHLGEFAGAVQGTGSHLCVSHRGCGRHKSGGSARTATTIPWIRDSSSSERACISETPLRRTRSRAFAPRTVRPAMIAIRPAAW